jgi:hypothetical protein
MSLGAEELNWRTESVSGDGSRMIEKRWIRSCKEEYMCAAVEWDCYKSVANIWLVKTENTGLCVTVYCKRPPWSRGNVPTSWPEWRGFKPSGGRRIIKDGKIQGTESSGRDFKPFDPCSRFTARSQREPLGQIG